MSILANLLKKNDQRQDSGEIPPGLLQTVASAGPGKDKRRTYLMIGLAAAVAIAGGGLLVVYLQTRIPSQPIVAQRTSPAQLPAVAVQAVQSSAKVAAPPASVETVVKETTRQTAVAHLPKKNLVPVKAVSTEKHGTATKKQFNDASGAEQRTVVKDRATLDAYLFAAHSAEARRDYSQALQLYRKALAGDPQNYRVMNNLASVCIRMGLYDEALGYVNRALRLKGDYASALVNGGIAQVKLGNESGARTMFSRAVAVEPTNRQALFNLALSQERSKALGDALTSYRRLADTGDVQGLSGMARIRERQGETAEALRLYREVTALPEAGQQLKETARERIAVLDR